MVISMIIIFNVCGGFALLLQFLRKIASAPCSIRYLDCAPKSNGKLTLTLQ